MVRTSSATRAFSPMWRVSPSILMLGGAPALRNRSEAFFCAIKFRNAVSSTNDSRIDPLAAGL